ncbi:ribosomal protein L12 family [Kipferlia bialata]|uniref:Ribosomal protein L12 family n=1 Tax=Kipferlia bialata TaxID=797122 RepID=A0A9K3D429_9EUKA|nr:ribosomal protein L12 family [Kipferlia bialata]|eukprot:g9502.t1
MSGTAVVYAAMILADEGLEITTEKLETILSAAGVKVEAYWPMLFAQYLQDKDLKELVASVGSVGAGAAAPAEAGAAAEAAVEEEEEEEEESEEESMGGLFGDDDSEDW